MSNVLHQYNSLIHEDSSQNIPVIQTSHCVAEGHSKQFCPHAETIYRAYG